MLNAFGATIDIGSDNCGPVGYSSVHNNGNKRALPADSFVGFCCEPRCSVGDR